MTQEWPLTAHEVASKSLIISLGGDGTFLHTSSMIESDQIPILGINTDPSRSLGNLCNKFLYKERTKEKHIDKLFQ